MKSQINIYTCRACGGRTVTIDRDEGVTPFMIGCRAKAGCDGTAESSFYRAPINAKPTHEWFRPDLPTLTTLMARHPEVAEAYQDHIHKGGLLLREIATGEVIE